MFKSARTFFIFAGLLPLFTIGVWAIGEECASRLSPRAAQILRLVERGLERKLIQPEDLLKNDVDDPYTLHVADSDNMASRRAFVSLWSSFRERERQQLRLAFKNLATIQENHSRRAIEVRRENSAIFAPGNPRVLGELVQEDGWKFEFGTYAGRPVFVGHMRNSARMVGDILYDPWHPDPDRRLLPVTQPVTSIKNEPAVPGAFFEEAEATYFMRLDKGMLTKISEGSPAPALAETIPWMGLNKGYVTARVEGKNKLVVVTEGIDGVSHQLVLRSGQKFGGEPKVLAQIANVMSQPKLDWVNGRPILTYEDARKILVADLATDTVFPDIQIPKRYGATMAVSFADRGKELVVFVTFDVRGNIPTLLIYDIHSGSLLNSFAISSRTSMINFSHPLRVLEAASGDAFAYFASYSEEILITNLRTNQQRTIPAPNLNSDVGHISYRGQDYIIWGTSTGSVCIYELSSENTICKSVGRAVGQVEPVFYQDRPYAFILVEKSQPLLLPLFSEVTL